MKSKLVKELLAALRNIKESQSDVTLDMNDENKESVYNELLIPLMNLTNADDVNQLHSKLEFLINGDTNSEEYATVASALVDYILDDDESETNFSDELNSLLINCMAVLNTFNELNSGDNKESALLNINNEIIAIMNSQTENQQEDTVIPEETKNEAAGDPGAVEEELPPVEVEEEEVEPEGTGATMTIVSATEEVDETPWSDVNKIELKNLIKEAVDANEENKAVVDEVFALVKSYDKVADWQWPHHVVKEDRVILNVNGLKTASLFLLKPNSSKNLTSDERTAMAAHLLRHYDELKMDKPEKLTKVAEGKESCIVINIKDDELQEFGEMFKVNAEDIGTYVGLVEALLTDLVNSGIIDIESESADFDESVIAVKLNKSQTEEFIKYFDIVSDDIVSILANEFDNLSYKQTDSSIENKFQESNSKVVNLENTIEQLNTTIEDQKAQLQTLVNTTVDQHLTQTKFQAIIDFIKSSDSVDETIIQFINTVIEAENERDIQYMAKIGKSFMKATANSDLTRFVKKSNIISKFNVGDVSELLDLVTDKKESTTQPTVNKNVDRLSSYLD